MSRYPSCDDAVDVFDVASRIVRSVADRNANQLARRRSVETLSNRAGTRRAEMPTWRSDAIAPNH